VNWRLFEKTMKRNPTFRRELEEGEDDSAAAESQALGHGLARGLEVE
jgi:hypothetical protein